MKETRKHNLRLKTGFTSILLVFCLLLSACGATGNNGKQEVNDEKTVKITQVRSTTIIIEYADKKFLIDPMLAQKGTMGSFGEYPRGDKNPLYELTTDLETIFDVDAVLVTHLHPDHFDQKATELIPKDMPIYVQNESDQQQVQSYGFKNVIAINDVVKVGDISLIKTECQHGETPELAAAIGESAGFVLKADNEKTVYITGDTVWYDGIEKTLNEYKPDIVIAYAGANTLHSDNGLILEGGIDLTGFNGDLRLIMDENDVFAIHQALPSARIISTHMESLNHWILSREELRDFSEKNNFSDVLDIPLDGETLEY